MSIMTLWQPILLSAILAFVAGSVIWMIMPWHKGEWQKTSDEEGARAALRGLAPGQYSLPYCPDQSKLDDPDTQQKFKDGPIAFITGWPTSRRAYGSDARGRQRLRRFWTQ